MAYDANEVISKAVREQEEVLEFDDISKYMPQEEKNKLETILKVPDAAEPRTPRLGLRERWVFKALYERYGDDYKAMSRDIKMNPNQYTPKQLKKRVGMYLEHHREECEGKEATLIN